MLLMKNLFQTALLLIIFFIIGWLAKDYLYKLNSEKDSGMLFDKVKKETPLDKYTIENLSKINIEPGTLEISTKLEENADYISYLFQFSFSPNLDTNKIKATTGQINIPTFQKADGEFPIILMLRGYVDQELYKTGMGTKRASEEFAKNGFITVAPDFLGYAGSDEEADNIFETRFQTYVTVLSLIESLDQIDSWDGKNIFLWGHSNGGQIAITVLEIIGRPYPTTLWAPVSKPFPYSILYYTDEAEDKGKLIRNELAKFENTYDAKLYSLDNYFDRINSPIQIHQGTNDDAVPVSWSNSLVKNLRKSDTEVTYHLNPGADHNMIPSWNTTVNRDILFFNKHLSL